MAMNANSRRLKQFAAARIKVTIKTRRTRKRWMDECLKIRIIKKQRGNGN
jgi:hypothetical protein